jgi:RND family efflux transporter MFP subunit
LKTPLSAAFLAIPMAAAISACTHEQPPAEALRPVHTTEIRYANAAESNRYVGTVQTRHEVDQAFRIAGKIVQRRVDVGQTVREGDVLAVLDDTDFRLAVAAAQEQLNSATTQARQAESDRQRLEALKRDGSVSASDEERAQSNARTTKANAEAEARKLDLARNRLNYTVLRAPRSGVVTSVKFEIGQVVAEGQPVVSIANDGEPEIVVDVPEAQVEAFKRSSYKASLASAPEETFEVSLRELAPQAAAQTRTYRARLKPATARRLPLGATATLLAERKAAEAQVAPVPSAAITQTKGQSAVWVVHRAGTGPDGAVDLFPVLVHGYRNEEVLVSGLPPGALVVTAGVQKMAPKLRVALPGALQETQSNKAASR